MRRIYLFLLGIGIFPALAAAAEYRAGVAKVDITPSQPIWMSGYAARTKPSEGAAHKIWAKALALEDGKRGKVVIVTTDLIGLPRNVSDTVAAKVAQQYGLDRSRLLLNSSHTHTGPVVRPNLMTMYFLTEQQKNVLEDYGQKLVNDLVSVIGAAIGDLSEARVTVAHGKTEFAINRRQRAEGGAVRIGVNRDGPVDHDVPVIAVRSPDGKLRATLFGYACHNTTLGADIRQITGDYAGFAQLELEAMQPGSTALFLLLCGGDQNPNPRGTFDLAKQHGRTLATEVNRVLATPMKPVRPDLKASLQMVELAFARHTREQFLEEKKSTNKFLVSRAEAMLRAYDESRPLRSLPYPVQAIRLGKEATILALGGEVVVGYALRAKQEFGDDLIVAGYSNDVMSYIPTRKVLQEGGYEAVDSMIYYGMPGPYTEEVEETIFRSIGTVLQRTGLRRRR
jgi:hypothetical protein